MVNAQTLTPDEALVEYLRDHGLKRLSKRLTESGALDMVVTATPGIKDVLVLGKIRQISDLSPVDSIIVDAPAAGHAITFLSSASGMLDAVTVGAIETQARLVGELLTDGTRSQVVLVTLPEETPVNELVETAYSLEDRVGIKLGPVVVNGILDLPDGLDAAPDGVHADRSTTTSSMRRDLATLEAAAAFRRDRCALQTQQITRLGAELPLPQISLPFVFSPSLRIEDLRAMAASILTQTASFSIGESR
ncbi:MAG: hypothetical protein R2698_04605 [Microthrixaceae bacterium]